MDQLVILARNAQHASVDATFTDMENFFRTLLTLSPLACIYEYEEAKPRSPLRRIWSVLHDSITFYTE